MFDDFSFLEHTRRHARGLDAPIAATLAGGARAELSDVGVLKIEPSVPGDTDLVISSGVHGNETAPIEIVEGLASELLRGELVPRNRTLLIIGNPIAMIKGRRFDIENLNRLFNGKHAGLDHHEARRAARLEAAVREFYEAGRGETRRHYDLHTAIRGSVHKKFAIYPYPDGRPWDKSQLEFFLSSGIDTILLGHQPSGTFSYFTSHQFEAHGFTVELGQVRPFGENDMAEFAAITGNLRRLIAGEPVPRKPFDNADFNLFEVIAELIKKSENFRLNFPEDGKNFTEFKAGYQLTEDIDGGYRIERDGDAIVFPNSKVPVGQRVALIVRQTEI
ncbi:MAG: succinylglutamate desuccinylase [Parvularculaceae bacterium]